MSSPSAPTCWSAALSIGADHPALAGHFPARPLVPGVLLLDEIMYALCCAGERWRVETVKFHHTVLPGETLQLQVQRHEDGGYIFEARSDGQRVVSGLLLPQAAAAAPGSP